MIQHDLDDALNELAPPIIVAGLQVDTWCTWHDEQSPWPRDEFAGWFRMGAGQRDERNLRALDTQRARPVESGA